MSTEADGPAGFPQWRKIVELLHDSQPALCAVLEHGAPVHVSAERITVSFPEGSFFGRQASAEPAQKALAAAAERVLGTRPKIEIAYGLAEAAQTMAAEQAKERSEARAKIIETALSHPRVREAIEVFDAEGNVQVELEQ